ncbi:MAG: DUF3604 domain-containing protein [Pseudomonadales bacterium]|nr:DUF3604 domain-containing protein [Pseudomonadales bacterium]
MRRISCLMAAVIVCQFILLCNTVFAAVGEKSPYSPNANAAGQKQVLWGDTHLHTNLSLDARAFGVTLDQATAYRFARGEQVTSSNGLQVKLDRPLDFLVITDHSDAMGTMQELIAGNKRFLRDEVTRGWYEKLVNGSAAEKLAARMQVMGALTDGSAPRVLFNERFFRGIWREHVKTADAFNDPGRFTAMIGFEWTSSPGGSNLHRNVFYRDGARQAQKLLPFTSSESDNPEDLWRWMARYERDTGGRMLAAAHNGNISNGLMFPEINPETGEPLTADYAKTRARWEPLYEVTQIKGDGETHRLLSKNDEFADYETWDKGNFAGVLKQPAMLQYEYARAALTRGLQLEKSLGSNPFQFGMIGATDSHTALATAGEDNFFGKMAYMEPSAGRWQGVLGDVAGYKILGWEMAASGYTAVWAEKNTREAIFDAMARRETYATTGPRIIVTFDAVLGQQQVAMGGELAAAGMIAPTFAIAALKDPQGANLDRIQVVKGWVDSVGAAQERVFDVVWSGQRSVDGAGKLSAVGSTVNVANASYENSIGASRLQVQWRDPTFDASASAYYYARVLEIPTPRWTSYDAAYYQTIMSEDVLMATQERAYTSPIWYRPN